MYQLNKLIVLFNDAKVKEQFNLILSKPNIFYNFQVIISPLKANQHYFLISKNQMKEGKQTSRSINNQKRHSPNSQYVVTLNDRMLDRSSQQENTNSLWAEQVKNRTRKKSYSKPYQFPSVNKKANELFRKLQDIDHENYQLEEEIINNFQFFKDEIIKKYLQEQQNNPSQNSGIYLSNSNIKIQTLMKCELITIIQKQSSIIRQKCKEIKKLCKCIKVIKKKQNYLKTVKIQQKAQQKVEKIQFKRNNSQEEENKVVKKRLEQQQKLQNQMIQLDVFEEMKQKYVGLEEQNKRISYLIREFQRGDQGFKQKGEVKDNMKKIPKKLKINLFNVKQQDQGEGQKKINNKKAERQLQVKKVMQVKKIVSTNQEELLEEIRLKNTQIYKMNTTLISQQETLKVLTQTQKQVQKLTEEISLKETAIKDLKSGMSTNQSKQSELLEELKLKNTQIQKMNTTLISQQEALKVLTQTQKQVQKLTEQISLKETAIKDLKSGMSTNQSKQSELLEELKLKNTQIQKMKSSLLQLTYQLSFQQQSKLLSQSKQIQLLNFNSKQVNVKPLILPSPKQQSIFIITSQFNFSISCKAKNTSQLQINELKQTNQLLQSHNAALLLKIKSLQISLKNIDNKLRQSSITNGQLHNRLQRKNQQISQLRSQLQTSHILQKQKQDKQLSQMSVHSQSVTLQNLIQRIDSQDQNQFPQMNNISTPNPTIHILQQHKTTKINNKQEFIQLQRCLKTWQAQFKNKVLDYNHLKKNQSFSKFCVKSILHNNSYIKHAQTQNVINQQQFIHYLFSYASYLQLFFSLHFLIISRDKILNHMKDEEQLLVSKINQTDLNLDLYDSQMSIFHRNSTKFNTLRTSSQYSISVLERSFKLSKKQQEELAHKKQMNLKKVESDLQEIKNQMQMKYAGYIQKLDQLKQIRLDPSLLEELQSFKQNKIAKTMIQVLRQNQVMKKCLNQMMMSQALLSQQHNQNVFQEVSFSIQSESQRQTEEMARSLSMLDFDSAAQSTRSAQKRIKPVSSKKNQSKTILPSFLKINSVSEVTDQNNKKDKDKDCVIY